MSAQGLRLLWAHLAILPPFSRLNFQHLPTEQLSCEVQHTLKENLSSISTIQVKHWPSLLPPFFFFFSPWLPACAANEEWWWWWCGSPRWAMLAQKSKPCLALFLSTVSTKILCTFCAESPGKTILYGSLHSFLVLLAFQQHAFYNSAV